MKAPIVYLSGRFCLTSRARISALDRGFLYGDGLFETIRIYRGIPFALRAHLNRMRKGARRIGLAIPGSQESWEKILRGLLRRNRLTGADIAARITVTRGAGGDGLLPPRRVRPTTLVTLRPLDPNLRVLRERGIQIAFLPFHPGIGGFLNGVKTVDYVTALVGKRLARSQGAYEGVYCTPAGEILEGTTSNIFIVRDKRLFTPPLAAGVLPGVTRSLVMQHAKRIGYPVQELRLTKSDLETADEAFLTATTIEILPIRVVGRRRIGGQKRPVIRDLQQAFTEGHP